MNITKAIEEAKQKNKEKVGMSFTEALEMVRKKNHDERLKELANHPNVRKVPTYKFVHKELRRSLKNGDSYSIWRRFEQGIETWLCVIWHKNWRNRACSYDGTESYLREDVEEWVVNSLRRIHYSPKELQIVHDDFETMAKHPAFEIKPWIVYEMSTVHKK